MERRARSVRSSGVAANVVVSPGLEADLVRGSKELLTSSALAPGDIVITDDVMAGSVGKIRLEANELSRFSGFMVGSAFDMEFTRFARVWNIP